MLNGVEFGAARPERERLVGLRIYLDVSTRVMEEHAEEVELLVPVQHVSRRVDEVDAGGGVVVRLLGEVVGARDLGDQEVAGAGNRDGELVDRAARGDERSAPRIAQVEEPESALNGLQRLAVTRRPVRGVDRHPGREVGFPGMSGHRAGREVHGDEGRREVRRVEVGDRDDRRVGGRVLREPADRRRPDRRQRGRDVDRRPKRPGRDVRRRHVQVVVVGGHRRRPANYLTAVRSKDTSSSLRPLSGRYSCGQDGTRPGKYSQGMSHPPVIMEA